LQAIILKHVKISKHIYTYSSIKDLGPLKCFMGIEVA